MQAPMLQNPSREPVPIPRQLVLWKMVQHAGLRGLSLRGIAPKLCATSYGR